MRNWKFSSHLGSVVLIFGMLSLVRFPTDSLTFGLGSDIDFLERYKKKKQKRYYQIKVLGRGSNIW